MPHVDLYTVTAILGCLATVLVRWRREADWRAFDRTRRDVNSLTSQVADLERRLKDSEDDRARLESEKQKLQMQCDRQQLRIDELKTQNTEQAREIKSLHDEVEELKRKLAGETPGGSVRT